MDFHSRLSPPEDGTKSPHAQKRARNVNCVQNWFSFWSEPSVYFWAAAKPLLLIMRAVILLAHSWPQEHPLQLFTLSAEDAISGSTQTPLRALLLPDTAQVGTWSRPNFTSRGHMKDTFLLKHRSCSSQQHSLCEVKLRYVLWVRVQPACHLAVAQVALSGRMETAAPSLMLKGCCPAHWVAYTQTGEVLQAFSQSKGQISAKMKHSQHHLLHLDFLVETWRGTGIFATACNDQSTVPSTCPFAPLSAPSHSKAWTSMFCHVQSHPLPRHPRNQGWGFGGRLWTCIYSLEL